MNFVGLILKIRYFAARGERGREGGCHGVGESGERGEGEGRKESVSERQN